MVTITIPPKAIVIPLPKEDEVFHSPNSTHPEVYIESEDYYVRSLRDSDVNENLVSWFNRTDMLRGLNLNELNFTLASFRHFIVRFDNFHNYILGIFDRSNDSLVGFYTIDVNRNHKIGSLTTGIGDQKQRGKQTLWATIDDTLDHFYAERDIEKFTARILARNYAMLFNFKNNSRFVLEGHLKQECLAPNGERLDLLVFASFKSAPSTRAFIPRKTNGTSTV
ncbi:RimJ/RimL family protein N-acetyltransferase [Ochrobactrum sp. 19YEA23]|uniref:GNAT family N-acetyltransferase n=1 Tax=Ochrobactrum sp. 19YEA23 TaxID=3039854 RepID=UPI0024792DAE|nr:RimJ/RimL family protein N-acetyltransferase [Ochrobactrum sp. 19YEA23]